MRILLSLVLLALLLGLGMLATRRIPDRSDASAPCKVLGRELVEGVSLSRHGIYGVETVRCGVARLQKARFGFLTFGGFNELVLDDLSVVLPTEPDSCRRISPDVPIAPHEMLERLGVADHALNLGPQTLPLKFSRLKINHLSLFRLNAETNVVPVLVAPSAEAQNDGLALHDCGIISDGKTNVVGEALLRADVRFELIWATGKLIF